MKKVLLLFPTMLFYKIPIFNKLEKYLNEKGFELIVWATSYEDKNNEISFQHISNIEYSFDNYKKIIRDKKIDFIIDILFKSDPGLPFYIKVLLYAKLKSIPIIFYGHGVNLSSGKKTSAFLYNLFYYLFDGIILYTPNEISKIWRKFQYKITIANNTLDLEGRRELIHVNKEQIKKAYSIKEEKVILTTGRLQKRKKLEILFNAFVKYFRNSKKVAWVIVGPELSDELKSMIEAHDNIYYLGPVYNKKKISEIFFMSDVYSIPGWMGLGVIEAMYWGLPILTMDVKHAPEIYYLKDGKTGYLSSDIESFEEKLKQLISDNNKLQEFSRNTIEVYKNEATLNHMFSGFTKQLKRFN